MLLLLWVYLWGIHPYQGIIGYVQKFEYLRFQLLLFATTLEDSGVLEVSSDTDAHVAVIVPYVGILHCEVILY